MDVLQRAPRPTRSSSPRVRQRGQSLVEFTLVIPILVILFVGIADFGRIFNAGVVLEAAARDAAEHAAQKYLANPPGNTTDSPQVRLSTSAPTPGDSSYYADIHLDAAQAVCAEARQLPNTDFSGGNCATWPVVAACVHDGADPTCGSTPAGFNSSIPPQCSQMSAAWSNATPVTGERTVEVRVCYEFTPLLSLPLFSLGDFYLERTRTFTIPCYFVTGYGACG
jgi:hypothetical protein